MSPDAWTTDLLIWEAKIVLESLIHEEERLRTIIATSENENEIADLEDDLVKLRLTLKRLKKEAATRFGPSVLNFDKGAL